MESTSFSESGFMTTKIRLPRTLSNSQGECYIVNASCEEFMKNIPDQSVDAIYTDPPFRTGVSRFDPRDKSKAYTDNLSEEAWINLMTQLASHSKRILKPTGSIFLHLDWHGVYEAKIHVMDKVFGKDNFLGEIIWSYDWGARSKNCFSHKHDTILHYVSNNGIHKFDVNKVDRVPYKAPGLQMLRSKRLGKNDGEARIAAGKTVTDVFDDINVLGTSSHERRDNSYPTMKPYKLIKRLLAPVTEPGSVVIDPFSGSGATLEAAMSLKCLFSVGDISIKSINTICNRADKLNANYFLVEC